jgi:hypothetical protein
VNHETRGNIIGPPGAAHRGPMRTVREAHDWAVAHNAEIIYAPREFPEYGEHYATYFLDPHGLMLEVVCHSADET